MDIHLSRPVEGVVKSATISKNPNGHYFVSILCECKIDVLPKAFREVGIDLGLKDLAITK
jgi:putative transposase